MLLLLCSMMAWLTIATFVAAMCRAAAAGDHALAVS